MKISLSIRTILACFLGIFLLANEAKCLELTLIDVWYGCPGGATRIACNTVDHTMMVSIPRTGTLTALNDAGAIIESMTSIANPAAMALDASGACYVGDGRAIRKLAADGSTLFTLGHSDTFFVSPHDVAIAPNGRIFVADADDYIKIFDAQGNYLTHFGGHGWFNGRLDTPVSLAINGARNELIVADQNNYRIQVYNFDGDSLRRWGRHGNGDYTPGDFLRPWGLDVDSVGRVWTYDAVLNAMQVFDPLGNFLFMCRLDVPEFHGGVDLAIDGDHLYLTAPSKEAIYDFQMWEDASPRTMPFDLTITYQNGGLMLRWNPITDATEYHLFRSSTSEFEAQNTVDLGAITGTFFVDNSALALLGQAFYRVDAILPPGLCNIPNAPFQLSALNDIGSGGSIAEDHAAPHNVQRDISCTTCHFSNFQYPSPLPNWWNGDHLCKSCHVETGMATAEQNHIAGNMTIYCSTCHEPHFQQDQFPHDYIRTAVLTPNNGWRSTTYNQEADFVHGAPNYDGICEVCHTATAYYRNDGSGAPHHAGENCATCHSHVKGFAAN